MQPNWLSNSFVTLLFLEIFKYSKFGQQFVNFLMNNADVVAGREIRLIDDASSLDVIKGASWSFLKYETLQE